jgi:hypothetical protein
MSPIDDELRSMFHGRADILTPSPDPLAGIERRAGRLRRNRAAAAVAGTALAVAAIAVAVPAVLPADRTDPRPPQVANSQQPTPDTLSSTYALDPAAPWDYRGDRAVLGTGNLDTFQREWAIRHPGSTLHPLFGQVYAPSAQPEVLFVATGGDGPRWGFVSGSHAGPEFAVDQPLTQRAAVLAAALPGDEGTGRLLAVGAPEVTAMSYLPDGTTRQPMTRLQAGVFITALEGDQGRDQLQAYVGTEQVYAGAAPDTQTGVTPSPDAAGAPGNVLSSWPTRGVQDPQVLQAAKTFYAQSQSQPAAQPETKVLFAGSTADGTRYVLGQMWLPGATLADTVGYLIRKDGSVEPQLKARVTGGAAAVVMVLSDPTASPATETLVVVPQPGTGQVEYAADGVTFEPVSNPGVEYDGVTVLARGERAIRDGKDRVRILDGHGTKTFEDAVFNLLCGQKSCG